MKATVFLILLGLLANAAAQGPVATVRVIVEPTDARLILAGGELLSEAVLRSGVDHQVQPGTYVLEASHENHKRFWQVLTLEAGQTHVLRLALSEEPRRANRDGWEIVTGSTLIFLVLFLSGLLVYLWSVQTRYYALVSNAMDVAVDEIRTEQTPVLQPHRNGVPPDEVPVTISGPQVVTIGRPSSEFAASSEDQTNMNQLVWSVEPAGKAIVTPSKGAKVKVIATEPGGLTLTARWQDGGKTYVGEFATVASTARTRSLTIPWVGAGFGSIMLAAIIIAVLVILGYFEILGEGIIGTVLGSIAGYLFGVRTAQEG